MRHHVIYWSMAKRETDVDDVELATLRRRQEHGEVYIEFLDGVRLPLSWDHQARHWIAETPEAEVEVSVEPELESEPSAA